VGAGNTNENGEVLVAGVALAPPLGPAGGGGWRGVRGRRLAGRTRQLGRFGWRWWTRR